MFDALKGSCALPLLYRHTVTLQGGAVVDGGVSDPIPAEAAYRLGARHIVVIRSRTANFFKVGSLSDRLTALALYRDRGVMKAVQKTAERYKRAVDFMAHPPSDCKIVQIAPETAPKSTYDMPRARRSGGW